MPLDVYIGETPRGSGRTGPKLISLAVHGVAFVGLMNAPRVELPQATKSEYKQAFEGKEDQFIWFRFNKKLPDVTPANAKRQQKPPPPLTY